MDASAASVTDSLERELALLHDQRVIDHIRSLMIPPERQLRPWDYGRPGEAFPCWLVLLHPASDTGIAYCEHGFGPQSPWGLLFLGAERQSMGMDSGWFARFPDAYFDSHASSDLPIWRVFERRGGSFPGKPISAEGSWDGTWAEVMRLRALNPETQYDCWQSVYPPSPSP